MRKIVIHNHLPRARDVNAFEHALPREKEEENRDKLYKDSGITRVDNEYAGTGKSWAKKAEELEKMAKEADREGNAARARILRNSAAEARRTANESQRR
jgi:hypothetical protein